MGRVVLAVRVINDGGAPVEVDISSAYGSRTATVGAERASSYAFSSRLTQVPAGEVTVSVDGATVTAPYEARSCG